MKNLAISLLVLALSINTHAIDSVHTIEVTDRHLYGPGPFPDQKLKTAWIRNLKMDGFLNGLVKGRNNLGEPPNVSGEALQGKIVDGMLSDKTLINEDIDMSNAVIMNGQFNLLLAAVFGGSNNGDTFFYKDERYNWWIKDDIAIDPGFPAGIVKMDNFTFTTGPRVIPHSVQTELGYPGGTNQTGSLEAGRVAHGRLGDMDDDGFLDGVFNAIGRFPMDSIFLPGAPFVQLFEFKSDIPVSRLEAALLNAASAYNYSSVLNSLESGEHVDIPDIYQKIEERLSRVKHHLQSIPESDAAATENIMKQVSSLSSKNSKGLEQLYLKLVDTYSNKQG